MRKLTFKSHELNGILVVNELSELELLTEENNRIEFENAKNGEYGNYKPISDENLIIAKLKQFEQAVQSHLDKTARAKGYDDINSIAKYLVEGNQFYPECYAISIWCAEVWAYCYDQVDIFKGTVEEFILTLPKFED